VKWLRGYFVAQKVVGKVQALTDGKQLKGS
jgi:hypothetical protein